MAKPNFMALEMARSLKKKRPEESYMEGDPNEEDSLETDGNELFADEDEFGVFPEEDPEPEEKKVDKNDFARSYMLHRMTVRRR